MQGFLYKITFTERGETEMKKTLLVRRVIALFLVVVTMSALNVAHVDASGPCTHTEWIVHPLGEEYVGNSSHSFIYYTHGVPQLGSCTYATWHLGYRNQCQRCGYSYYSSYFYYEEHQASLCPDYPRRY